MIRNFIRTNHLAAPTMAACLASSVLLSNAIAMPSPLAGLHRPDHCPLAMFLLHSPARQVVFDLAKEAFLSLGEAKISTLLHCSLGFRPDAALWFVSNAAHLLQTIVSQVFCGS